MALSSIVVDASFSIEVADGVDAAGDTKYKRKTFGGLKTDADTQNVYDVSLAIQNILSAECGRTLVNVTSSVSDS